MVLGAFRVRIAFTKFIVCHIAFLALFRSRFYNRLRFLLRILRLLSLGRCIERIHKHFNTVILHSVIRSRIRDERFIATLTRRDNILTRNARHHQVAFHFFGTFQGENTTSFRAVNVVRMRDDFDLLAVVISQMVSKSVQAIRRFTSESGLANAKRHALQNELFQDSLIRSIISGICLRCRLRRRHLRLRRTVRRRVFDAAELVCISITMLKVRRTLFTDSIVLPVHIRHFATVLRRSPIAALEVKIHAARVHLRIAIVSHALVICMNFKFSRLREELFVFILFRNMPTTRTGAIKIAGFHFVQAIENHVFSHPSLITNLKGPVSLSSIIHHATKTFLASGFPILDAAHRISIRLTSLECESFKVLTSKAHGIGAITRLFVAKPEERTVAQINIAVTINVVTSIDHSKIIQIKVLVVEVITHRQAPTIRASPLCGAPRIKTSVTIAVLGYIVITVTFRQAELQVFRHPYTAANLHRRIAFAITVIDQEIPRFIIGRSILVLVRSVRILLSRRLSRSRRLHSTFFIRNTTIKFLRKLSKVIVVLIRSNPNLATPHRRTHKRTRIIDASEKHIGATIVLLFRSKRIVHIRTTPVARIAEHVVKATGNHCSIA